MKFLQNPIKVSYTRYGKTEHASVVQTSDDGKIFFLDNGRWMHANSCTEVKEENKKA